MRGGNRRWMRTSAGGRDRRVRRLGSTGRS
ncbi:uncharacterized protein M6B38_252910 [Iris pallida]|uniref:Uncharacterized protein n=1 Tax=Iris pallida TaxID=29817 RepID=A0AAX6IJA1_IRIPA|nr:uncharacterized protein M6B38_252910 [Iris pallida]